MADRLPVKKHLRNGALYQSPMEPLPGGEWKRRLFHQYSIHRQLIVLLQERISLLKWFVCAGIPSACIALVFAAYFGFIHPGDWLEKVIQTMNFDIPVIGMQEALILIAIINGWVLFTRRRIFMGT